MKNRINLEASWLALLNDELEKPYIKELASFLDEEERAGKRILPPQKFWFTALNATPLKSVKVVILGQDPYPTEGYAHGLCFSVLPTVQPLPQSLLNINKELLSDLNIDNSSTGYLLPWAEEGVLLLNAVLTVEEGRANSHQQQGWEKLSNKIIELINDNLEHVVFILWGAYAQKKGKLIDEEKHFILKAPHPSPLSAYRGFFGSKPFSKTNEYLKKHEKNSISWKL